MKGCRERVKTLNIIYSRLNRNFKFESDTRYGSTSRHNEITISYTMDRWFDSSYWCVSRDTELEAEVMYAKYKCANDEWEKGFYSLEATSEIKSVAFKSFYKAIEQIIKDCLRLTKSNNDTLQAYYKDLASALKTEFFEECSDTKDWLSDNNSNVENKVSKANHNIEESTLLNDLLNLRYWLPSHSLYKAKWGIDVAYSNPAYEHFEQFIIGEQSKIADAKLVLEEVLECIPVNIYEEVDKKLILKERIDIDHEDVNQKLIFIEEQIDSVYTALAHAEIDQDCSPSFRLYISNLKARFKKDFGCPDQTVSIKKNTTTNDISDRLSDEEAFDKLPTLKATRDTWPADFASALIEHCKDKSYKLTFPNIVKSIKGCKVKGYEEVSFSKEKSKNGNFVSSNGMDSVSAWTLRKYLKIENNK